METFDENKNLARVAAGMKGGPFFKNPLVPQKMTFVDGYPPESLQKIKAGEKSSQPVEEAVWAVRRSNGSSIK